MIEHVFKERNGFILRALQERQDKQYVIEYFGNLSDWLRVSNVRRPTGLVALLDSRDPTADEVDGAHLAKEPHGDQTLAAFSELLSRMPKFVLKYHTRCNEDLGKLLVRSCKIIVRSIKFTSHLSKFKISVDV